MGKDISQNLKAISFMNIRCQVLFPTALSDSEGKRSTNLAMVPDNPVLQESTQVAEFTLCCPS